MSKKLRWRGLLVLIVIAIALIYLTPSISKTLPPWWPNLLPKEKIHLGLDLKGGMHLVLEVQAQRAVETHLERTVEDIKYSLRNAKIRYRELQRSGPDRIGLTLLRDEDRKAVEGMVANSFPELAVESGSFAEREPKLELVLSQKAQQHIKRMAVDQAVETITNRIDQFGVAEPDIRPQGRDRILVQLPGIKDPKRAIDIIGKTALLEFKLVDEDNSLEEALRGNMPPGDEVLYQIKGESGSQKKIPFLLKKRAVLTGEYLTDARVQIGSQYNEPYVSLSFDSRGARLFERITGANIKKWLAIVLDDVVNSAPVIQDRITGGRAQITGRFTMEEARDLAIVLRAGALPAPVKIIEERTVGPSLGRDSIDKGLKSMIIGGLIVILFMVVYYRFAGILADLALFLNIVFIAAGLALFGATLTMPGIAGVILIIGMAIDANVLVFERIREELRLGKTPRAAVDGGYSKALVTILDANITTLIAALVLFQFGTGPVKGFAVTLSIGIVASLFTAVFITRLIFDYLIIERGMKKISI
ncbi:MAG: protein translocase subunit SecD [Deltaproteobacteria bacterium]|nr:MAG: protein translocase subunit SecD [Deltaproteobacteria bacterium]